MKKILLLFRELNGKIMLQHKTSIIGALKKFIINITEVITINVIPILANSH